MCVCVNALGNDFMDVKLAVYDVMDRWQGVAHAIGLNPSQVRTIQAQHPGNIEGCLDESLYVWLRRAHNEEKFGPPTWKKLVEAVAARAGGQNRAVSLEIAKEHTSECGICAIDPFLVRCPHFRCCNACKSGTWGWKSCPV